jgi:hypothetical protein
MCVRWHLDSIVDLGLGVFVRPMCGSRSRPAAQTQAIEIDLMHAPPPPPPPLAFTASGSRPGWRPRRRPERQAAGACFAWIALGGLDSLRSDRNRKIATKFWAMIEDRHAHTHVSLHRASQSPHPDQTQTHTRTPRHRPHTHTQEEKKMSVGPAVKLFACALPRIQPAADESLSSPSLPYHYRGRAFGRVWVQVREREERRRCWWSESRTFTYANQRHGRELLPSAFLTAKHSPPSLPPSLSSSPLNGSILPPPPSPTRLHTNTHPNMNNNTQKGRRPPLSHRPLLLLPWPLPPP